MSDTMTWHDLYRKAVADALHAYEDKKVSKQDFLDTVESFYDEYSVENIITSYPYDPPSSKRAALSRATVVYVDDVQPNQ